MAAVHDSGSRSLRKHVGARDVPPMGHRDGPALWGWVADHPRIPQRDGRPPSRTQESPPRGGPQGTPKLKTGVQPMEVRHAGSRALPRCQPLKPVGRPTGPTPPSEDARTRPPDTTNTTSRRHVHDWRTRIAPSGPPPVADPSGLAHPILLARIFFAFQTSRPPSHAAPPRAPSSWSPRLHTPREPICTPCRHGSATCGKHRIGRWRHSGLR